MVIRRRLDVSYRARFHLSRKPSSFLHHYSSRQSQVFCGMRVRLLSRSLVIPSMIWTLSVSVFVFFTVLGVFWERPNVPLPVITQEHHRLLAIGFSLRALMGMITSTSLWYYLFMLEKRNRFVAHPKQQNSGR